MPCRYLFYQTVLLLFFYQKQIFVLHSSQFSKTISWTCFNNFSKTDSESIILKVCAINFSIYICHQIPDEFKVQKQLKHFAIFTGKHLCRSIFLIKSQASSLWISPTLRTPISKIICERLLLVVVIYCIENWIHLFRNQISLLFLLKHKITLFYLPSFVFIRFISRYPSLSLIVAFYYSLSFVVTCCTTRCHLLYNSLSLVVILCATRCHSLSLVVVCCIIRCYSLSLDLPLVCLFINNPFKYCICTVERITSPIKTRIII